jgi:hypothetical protein
MQTPRLLASALIAISLLGCSPDAPSSSPANNVELDEPSLSVKCIDGDITNCRMCVDGVIKGTYCTTSQYCSSDGETCVSKKSLGSSCTSGTQCLYPGYCVDGRCCNASSCPGGCNSCANSSGACQILAAGSTPGNDCTLSKTPPCGAVCNGGADCVYPASGTGSCSSSQCVGTKASGYSWVTGSSTCNGTGGCKTPTTGGSNCGNYICSSGCLTSCTDSTKCIDSAYCSGSACLDKVGKGVECPTADACAATAGTCAPAADGKQRCCLVTCTSPQACSLDGTKCVGTTPFGGACTGDDQCATGMCAGSKCVSCKGDTDCSPADYCDTTAGKCNIRAGIGATCTTSATCPTGSFCTDGVCCVQASCGVGGTCAGTKKGQCAKSNGSTCSGDFDCDSAHCVDKVCCDSLCDKQCEACSVDGSVGKCVAVKGLPVGMRPSCDPGTSSNPCSRASCDGATRDKCAALAGSEVECRMTSCAGGEAIGRATCDGTGNCPEPVKALCGAYQCAAPDGTCRTSCTTAADCATGNVCRDSQCEPRTSECTDATTSTSREGVPRACPPFLCDTSSGNCFETCTTSEQCAPGNLCDGGTCVAAPKAPDGGDDGGCSTSGAGSPGSGLWLFGALSLAASMRRRAAR